MSNSLRVRAKLGIATDANDPTFRKHIFTVQSYRVSSSMKVTVVEEIHSHDLGFFFDTEEQAKEASTIVVKEVVASLQGRKPGQGHVGYFDLKTGLYHGPEKEA